MYAKIHHFLGIVLGLALISGACSEAPVRVGPKFNGRLLVLANPSSNGADLIEITSGSNSTLSHSTLTSGVFEAVANADHTQLLYTTHDGIFVRDLVANEVKPLVKGQSFCLAWSPDGKRLSYAQRSDPHNIKLFAATLDGKTKLVSEDYLADSPGENRSSSKPAESSTCAHWVARDKLIFDRMGPSQKRGADVKPNTTTLATVSDTVKLVDTERKWSVEGICQTGAAILRSQDQDQILIAKSLENPKTANPSDGPCSACRFVGFAANSCVPFFIEDSSSTSSDLFYLNPTNWQRQRSTHIGQPFSLNAKMLINSAARLMVVGDAVLLLVDTETGDVTTVFPKTELPSPQPVVWIEK